MKKLSFTQLNCCKSPPAARQLSEVAHQSDFLIISEPPLVRNHPKYLGPNFVVLSGPDPSAVIAVKKNLARNTIFMGDLSDNFVCTVALDMGNSTLYLSSVYIKPSWSITQFETELEFLGKVINGLPRSKHLVAGDFNSWNTAWGSRKSNKKVSLLLNFLSSFGYTVFNSGKRPTFQRGSHVSVIDLSVTSSELLPHTSNWTVKQNLTSLSDHNLIQFSLNDITLISPLLTNRKFHTKFANWDNFTSQIKTILDSYNPFIQSITNARELSDCTEEIEADITELCTKCFPPNTNIHPPH